MGAWVPAAITAVSGLLGSALSASSSSKQTRKNRNEAARQFDENQDFLKYQYEDQVAKQDWYYHDQKQQDQWTYWDQNRRQDEYAKNAAGWQMDDLMQTADEAGIHRLAALGGASAGYNPVTSSGQGASSVSTGAAPPTAGNFGDGTIMGDAIAEAGRAIAAGYETSHQKKMRTLAERHAAAEAEIAESQSRTLIAEERKKAQNGPSQVSQEWDGRPKSAPWRDRIPVRIPDGTKVAMLPSNIAKRLGLNSMDTMTAGDVSEIAGELAGEGAAFLNTVDIFKQMGIPLFGAGAEKPKVKKKPEEGFGTFEIPPA